jgi:signal transduction histidine kinase
VAQHRRSLQHHVEPFMLEADDAFVQRVCDLLFEISQENLTLSDDVVEAESDANRRAVFTGLLMLYDELRFQNERRAQAEIQLRQREARMSALIEQAKVAILDCGIRDVLDALGDAELKGNGKALEQDTDLIQALTSRLVIHAANPEALRMMGAETTEQLDAHLKRIAGGEGAGLFSRLWKGLAEGNARVEAESPLRRLDGESITVLAALSAPERDQEEDVAILTFADITAHHARVAAEQEAARRGEELSRVNAEVERLFYAVAHDLRSPLRAVDTLAAWIAEDLDAGEVGEVKNHITTLRLRIERLDRMLTDLLSYARIGRTQHPVEHVDVNALLEEITKGLLEIPAGFEVRWSEMPALATHRTLLSQVFLNLIANAIKHHDRNTGLIEVAAEDAGDWVVFRVSDDGPGIPLKYRQRIFGLFSTLKRRDEVEGSGMGLAFVQKVVRKLGGQVSVQGPEGRGATFVFQWPKAAPDETRA